MNRNEEIQFYTKDVKGPCSNEWIFVTKILTPNVRIDIILSVWLYTCIDGVYVVSNVGCSTMSTCCTSWGMPLFS